MTSTEYEWEGLHYVRPDYPPYIVERVPYDVCPRCDQYSYRPVYDGRTGEAHAECKECHYEEALSGVEPDCYVHDANKGEAEVLLVVFALAALIGVVWLVLHLLGIV